MAYHITVLITNVKSISNVYFHKKDKLKLINGDTINEVTTGVKYCNWESISNSHNINPKFHVFLSSSNQNVLQA